MAKKPINVQKNERMRTVTQEYCNITLSRMLFFMCENSMTQNDLGGKQDQKILQG